MIAKTQGSVALYARDARWRRAVAKRLVRDGHSCEEVRAASGVGDALRARRFDVLALNVRDEADSRAIAEGIGEARLPLHTVVVGSASSLGLTLHRRRGGTFRYVPGRLTSVEVARLIELALCAGGWEEAPFENGTAPLIEEVDLKDLLDEAAVAVYSSAKRKRLRFNTTVEGPSTSTLGDPQRLVRAFERLLGLVVSLAPRDGLVSVEAEGSGEDWVVRFRLGNGRPLTEPGKVAGTLREQTRTLSAVSKELKEQGGMLWVELGGPHAFAFSLTLPPAPETQGRASA
jgi:hypothetical protein